MFENLGFQEITLIAVVFIVFFGPKKIPELMNGIGRGVREFKKAMNEVQGEITKMTHMPVDDQTIARPEPPPHKTQSVTAETLPYGAQVQTANPLPHENQSSATE
jgi:sec-independent protein translocase protein TatA